MTMSVRVFPKETYREPFCAILFHDKDRFTSRYIFGSAQTTRSDIVAIFSQFECFLSILNEENVSRTLVFRLLFGQRIQYTSRYIFGFAKTTRSDIVAVICQFECFRRKHIENLFVQPIFMTKTDSLLDTILPW